MTWLATIESVLGIPIEGTFVAMNLRRLETIHDCWQLGEAGAPHGSFCLT
jgi:hypothetical protein